MCVAFVFVYESVCVCVCMYVYMCVYVCMYVRMYEGSSESKERLAYNPHSCFIVPDQSFGVFSRV